MTTLRPRLALFVKWRLCWLVRYWPTAWLWLWADRVVDQWHRKKGRGL